MIAPARTLSRIISGDAWKTRRTSGRQFGEAHEVLQAFRDEALKNAYQELKEQQKKCMTRK
jgi:hypothetical protein